MIHGLTNGNTVISTSPLAAKMAVATMTSTRHVANPVDTCTLWQNPKQMTTLPSSVSITPHFPGFPSFWPPLPLLDLTSKHRCPGLWSGSLAAPSAPPGGGGGGR